MKIRHLFLASSLLLISGQVFAQTVGTSDVAVTINNQAITLNNVAGLNFGTVLPFGRNGSVTVNTLGQGSASNVFLSDVTNVSASEWEVSGVPNAPFAVTLPPNNTVTVTNGTDTMVVTSFARTGGASNLALDGGGNRSFNVGATLLVNANQPEGVYTGTFDVSVVYN